MSFLRSAFIGLYNCPHWVPWDWTNAWSVSVHTVSSFPGVEVTKSISSILVFHFIFLKFFGLPKCLLPGEYHVKLIRCGNTYKVWTSFKGSNVHFCKGKTPQVPALAFKIIFPVDVKLDCLYCEHTFASSFTSGSAQWWSLFVLTSAVYLWLRVISDKGQSVGTGTSLTAYTLYLYNWRTTTP